MALKAETFHEDWLEYAILLIISIIVIAVMVAGFFPRGAFLMMVLGLILGVEASWYGAPYSFIGMAIILLGLPLLYFNISAYVFYVLLYSIGYYSGYRGLLQRFKNSGRN